MFIQLTVTRNSPIGRERIFVFPVQQWLGERAKMLLYTYVNYHVNETANVRVT